MSGLTSINENWAREKNKSVQEDQLTENTNKKQGNTQKSTSVTFNDNDNHITAENSKKHEENEEQGSDSGSGMSGFTSLLEGNSRTTKIWEGTENSPTAEKIRKDKETKVKNTLAQFNVSSTDVVNWTSKNPKIYQEFSKNANHDEYNTLKQVIKDIIKKRNTKKEKDAAFNKMMVLSKKKSRECQESENPINHPNQLKSSLKPRKFKRWGLQE